MVKCPPINDGRSKPADIKVKISKTEPINEVKQYLVDMISANQPFTCFSLWLDGEPVNKFIPVEEIPDIKDGCELQMVPDAYTEAESKLHVTKVRELVGFESENIKSLSAIDSGISLFEPLIKVVEEAAPSDDFEIDFSNESKKPEEMTEDEIAALKQAQMKPILDHPMTVPEDTPEDAPLLKHGKFSDLLPQIPSESTKSALRSLQLSQWNPPPPKLKLKGHLLYLQASTLEGKTFHITSTTTGYYVSNCAGERFDPSPRKISGKFYSSHSLFALLGALSPAMAQQMEKNTQLLNERNPLTLIHPTNTFLSSPWYVREKKIEESNFGDISRTQESLFNTNKLDNSSVRDWNDDLQSTKEMPTQGEDVTIQDKVLRERLMNKLAFDFSDAAVKGAISVVKGDIAPLNPSEPTDAQIFLSNNIFYSFGVDGIGTFANEGGDPAARYSVGKDLAGVNFVNRLDIDGLCVLATCVVDYCGRRVVCQGPVPGIFRQNTETSQIVYGGIENRETIVKDEEFEPYLQSIADTCHLKKHPVYDSKMETATELVTPVDTKGLAGTDGRRYVLDLYRLAPLDLSFVEQYSNDKEAPYPHKIPVLRFEAVDEWFRNSLREDLNKDKKEESEEEKKEKSKEQVEAERKEQEQKIKDLSAKYKLNPDVGFDAETIPKEHREQYKKDQQEVRDVCKFVTDKLIPTVVQDVLDGAQPAPLDGAQLTNVLHRRGINMRYLGAIHKAIEEKNSAQLDMFKGLVIREAIVRSCKNLLNTLLKDTPTQVAPYIIAHFFNCLFDETNKPSFELPEELKTIYPQLASFEEFTAETIFEKVSHLALCKFRLNVGKNWFDVFSRERFFRDLSIKMGLQWRARTYNFINNQQEQPVKTNGKKSSSAATVASFCSDEDILNIVPVIKASTYRSHYAEEALEVGRSSIFQNQEAEVGKEFIYESLTLHEQVYGLVHPEVAKAYSQAAAVFNELFEMDIARDLTRKAIIISERCSGVDNAETIYFCLNLAFFEHRAGNSAGALYIIDHAIKLWTLVLGEDHPDTLTILLNVGTMLQSIKDYKRSIVWLKASIDLATKLFGEDSLQVANYCYQLSQPYILLQDYNEALNMVRRAHPIFEAKLGEDNKTTKDCKHWLDQLVQAAVQSARMQKISGLRRPVIPRGSGANMVRQPSSTQASRQSSSMGDKSVDEIMQYINGETSSKKKKNKKNKKKN